MNGGPPTEAQVANRRGASGPSGGINSFVFFGGIILLVAVAGGVGITLWGPDKTIEGRSHLASDPQPPDSLPSLPPDTPPAAASDAPADSASAAPADSTAPADDPPKKGKKKGRKGK